MRASTSFRADPPVVHVALDDVRCAIAFAAHGVGEVAARVIENIVAAIVDELDDTDRGKSQTKPKARGLVDLLRGGRAFFDFIDAFASQDAFDKLYPKWERECRTLLDAGADVIVPAGGLSMMLYGSQPGANLDGAPIINGITRIAKPPEKALREFLDSSPRAS